MDKCKTCKWWERGTEVGTCTRMHIATKLEHWGVFVLLPSEIDESPTRRMMTPHNFGCCHHQPNDQERAKIEERSRKVAADIQLLTGRD